MVIISEIQVSNPMLSIPWGSSGGITKDTQALDRERKIRHEEPARMIGDHPINGLYSIHQQF